MADDDILKLGDIVRLGVGGDMSTRLLVRGEGHVLKNVVAVATSQRVGADDDFLFQVCPELEYKAAAELRGIRRRRTPSFSRGISRGLSRQGSGISRQSSGSMDEGDFQIMDILNGQAKEEARSNAQRLRALQEDRSAMKTVEYGEVVQLRHVASGCFLS